jgi:hypothetical protein
MALIQRATELYSVKDEYFKSELLRVVSVMSEEIADLRGEVVSLQNQIDTLTYNTKD